MTTAQQFENFDENYGEDHEYGQEFVFNDYLPDSNLQQRNKDFGQREVFYIFFRNLDWPKRQGRNPGRIFVGAKIKRARNS